MLPGHGLKGLDTSVLPYSIEAVSIQRRARPTFVGVGRETPAGELWFRFPSEVFLAQLVLNGHGEL